MIVTPLKRSPRLPGDSEDDRRDPHADDRISHRKAERDQRRARNDRQAHESIGARVEAVGHKRGAVEFPPGADSQDRRQLVSQKPYDARRREDGEVAEWVGMEDASDRLDQSDAGADEDRQDDRFSSPPLAAIATKKKGDSERNRRQCIAEVVNEVGEQGDAPRREIDQPLKNRCREEDEQTPGNDPNAAP